MAPYHWDLVKSARTSYAHRRWTVNGRRYHQFMHSLLTGLPRVDHQGGDGLDNRRCKLREATCVQNARNCRDKGGSSRFKGVSWDRGHAKWLAQIMTGGRTSKLGRFHSEIEAALAYDRAAVDLFGEFAMTNEMLGMLPCE